MILKGYIILHVFVFLQTRDWFLLARSETEYRSASSTFSYYVLQSSASLSLLLKPVVTRELMLPCDLPVSSEEPPFNTLNMMKVCKYKICKNKHKHGSIFKWCGFNLYGVRNTWLQPKHSQIGRYVKCSGSTEVEKEYNNAIAEARVICQWLQLKDTIINILKCSLF